MIKKNTQIERQINIDIDTPRHLYVQPTLHRSSYKERERVGLYVHRCIESTYLSVSLSVPFYLSAYLCVGFLFLRFCLAVSLFVYREAKEEDWRKKKVSLSLLFLPFFSSFLGDLFLSFFLSLPLACISLSTFFQGREVGSRFLFHSLLLFCL